MIDGPGFVGFGPNALRWFEGLLADNSRDWFRTNRATYEGEVSAPLTALLDELAARRGGVSKVYRQHRDVRFSKDKSPYKTHAYGVAGTEGRLGIYVSIAAEGLPCGTGFYAPDRERLASLRDAIANDESGEKLSEILAMAAASGVQLSGDALQTAPRGFAKDHPRIDLLRRKQFLLFRSLPPSEKLDGRRPFDFALETGRMLDPFIDWAARHAPA